MGDLLIDVNGQSIPTDRPEYELRAIFARFKRPVTLGFYKIRRATEQVIGPLNACVSLGLRSWSAAPPAVGGLNICPLNLPASWFPCEL